MDIEIKNETKILPSTDLSKLKIITSKEISAEDLRDYEKMAKFWELTIGEYKYSEVTYKLP